MKKDIDSIAYPVNAILLIGPTGSGKSPLCDLLTSRGLLGKRTHHLDFGSELRSIASGAVSGYASAEKDFVIGVLDHGVLLENEHFVLARKIIDRMLVRERFRTGDILALNGIPRHAGQAQDIAGIATVHAIAVLDCSVDSVFLRLEENTGGDRTHRVDDERALVEKKLKIFSERTAPLIRHYQSRGSRIYRIEINERTTTGSAYHALSTLASADPPVAFVAEPPQR